MLSLKVLILIFLSNYMNMSFGQNCDIGSVRKFDTTFARLLTLGASGRSFPENKQDQLKKYCNQTFEYIHDIDKYKNKCLKQLPKQVTGVVVYSVRNAINQYCKRDSRKLTDLINSFTCANKVKFELDQCYSNLIDSFQGALNAKEKLKVPHMCCEYYKLFECIKDKSLKNKNCNEFQVETTSNFVRELFGNVVDLLCTDYVEGSDKCETLGPVPKKKKTQRRTKSFMLPLIDVLASLPEV